MPSALVQDTSRIKLCWLFLCDLCTSWVSHKLSKHRLQFRILCSGTFTVLATCTIRGASTPTSFYLVHAITRHTHPPMESTGQFWKRSVQQSCVSHSSDSKGVIVKHLLTSRESSSMKSTPFRSVPPDRLTIGFLASSATKRLATELCDVVGAWPRHCTSGPGTEKHELHKSTVYPLDLMSGCWRRVVHVTRPNLFIGGMN